MDQKWLAPKDITVHTHRVGENTHILLLSFKNKADLTVVAETKGDEERGRAVHVRVAG